MISGCSRLAEVLGLNWQALGNVSVLLNTSCLQGFPLAQAALLVLSILSRQDSKGGGVLGIGDAPWHDAPIRYGHSLSLGDGREHFVSFIGIERYFSLKQPLEHVAPVCFHAWCTDCIYPDKNLSHSGESTPPSTTDGTVVIFPISELESIP